MRELVPVRRRRGRLLGNLGRAGGGAHAFDTRAALLAVPAAAAAATPASPAVVANTFIARRTAVLIAGFARAVVFDRHRGSARRQVLGSNGWGGLARQSDLELSV